MDSKDWVAYICAGAGLLAALVAMLPSRVRTPSAAAAIALFAGAGIIGLTSPHKASPQRASTGEASPSPASQRAVPVDILQPGDCIAGGDLRLDNYTVPMPSRTQVLPCGEPHDGEVFLAADPWAEDAVFPGDNAVNDLVNGRCEETFRSYVGMDYAKSALEYVGSKPTSDSWESDDRHIICIAYDPEGKLTGSVRRAAR